MSQLSERIKHLMRENGITSVNALSRQTGITLSALQAVVNGFSKPRPATLRTLSHFFGVSPKDLVSDFSDVNIGPIAFQSVSEVLKYLIEDICVSERELSRLTGVQFKIINNIVVGHTKNPTDASLLPIAKFFSITLKQLRGEEPIKMLRKSTGNNGATVALPVTLPVGTVSEMKQWSASRKKEVVLRLLRGEPVDAVSREVSVPISRLEEWRDRALTGMDASLKD